MYGRLETKNHTREVKNILAHTHSINFTVEWEEEEKIPFLDSVTHRRSSGFSFEVYRMPNNSGQFVHCFSRLSDQIKLSVLSSMFLRNYRLSDPEFTDKETSYIYDKFSKLGYPRRLIDEAHRKAQQHSDHRRSKNHPNIALRCDSRSIGSQRTIWSQHSERTEYGPLTLRPTKLISVLVKGL